MGIRDLTGIFSRYFVVGYFVPAVSALGTLALLLTSAWEPNAFESLAIRSKLLVLGLLGVFIGGVLLGLRFFVRELFIGIPGADTWPLRALRHRQGRRYNELLRLYEEAEERRGAADADAIVRHALITLDRWFPDDPSGLRPTRFGNVVGAYESYPWTRFRLDASGAWKRIDALLSPREQELHAIARSDVEVLLNGSLLATVVGLAVLVDRVVHPSPVSASAVGFFALSYVLYRLAASAEGRLGDEKRASFDLHRFELYQALGLRAPTSLVDERSTLAPAVNELLQFGGDVPDELWAGEYPQKR